MTEFDDLFEIDPARIERVQGMVLDDPWAIEIEGFFPTDPALLEPVF